VNEVDIGKYKIKNVIASFPVYREEPGEELRRDGSLGVGLLKRFTLIVIIRQCTLFKTRPQAERPF